MCIRDRVGAGATGEPDAGIVQRILVAMVVLGLLLLVLTAAQSLITVSRGAAQVAATGDALMHSQRLAKIVTQAMQGTPAALNGVRESSQVLVGTVRDLRSGSANLPALPGAYTPLMDELAPFIDRTEANANTVLAQQAALVKAAAAVRGINDRSADLLAAAESAASAKFEAASTAAESNAMGQLVMLTQRIAKSANEFQSVEGVSPESAFLLGRDVNTFRDVTQALLQGNSDLRISAVRDGTTRERLLDLQLSLIHI